MTETDNNTAATEQQTPEEILAGRLIRRSVKEFKEGARELINFIQETVDSLDENLSGHALNLRMVTFGALSCSRFRELSAIISRCIDIEMETNPRMRAALEEIEAKDTNPTDEARFIKGNDFPATSPATK